MIDKIKNLVEQKVKLTKEEKNKLTKTLEFF